MKCGTDFAARQICRCHGVISFARQKQTDISNGRGTFHILTSDLVWPLHSCTQCFPPSLSADVVSVTNFVREASRMVLECGRTKHSNAATVPFPLQENKKTKKQKTNKVRNGWASAELIQRMQMKQGLHQAEITLIWLYCRCWANFSLFCLLSYKARARGLLNSAVHGEYFHGDCHED